DGEKLIAGTIYRLTGKLEAWNHLSWGLRYALRPTCSSAYQRSASSSENIQAQASIRLPHHTAGEVAMPVVQRHAVATVDSATDKATALVGERRGFVMRAGTASE